MPRINKWAALTFLLSFSGCTTLSRQVADPNAISLEQAMSQIGPSFRALSVGLEGQKLGVIPCEIEINFNISATATDTTNAGVTASPKLVITSANLGYTGQSTGVRGNVINIKLQHTACLPAASLGANKKAFEELNSKLDELKQIYSRPPAQ